MSHCAVFVFEVARPRLPTDFSTAVQMERQSVAAGHERPPEAIQAGKSEHADGNRGTRLQAIPIDANVVKDRTQKRDEDTTGPNAQGRQPLLVFGTRYMRHRHLFNLVGRLNREFSADYPKVMRSDTGHFADVVRVLLRRGKDCYRFFFHVWVTSALGCQWPLSWVDRQRLYRAIIPNDDGHLAAELCLPSTNVPIARSAAESECGSP